MSTRERSHFEQSFIRKRRNLYTVFVQLFDANDTLCAEGYATYFTFSKEKAEKHFYYPEFEEFFKD